MRPSITCLALASALVATPAVAQIGVGGGTGHVFEYTGAIIP